MGPGSLLLIVVLRHFHLVAANPAWVYAICLVGPAPLEGAANALYARRPGPLGMHVRAAADGIAATLAIYPTGWGPALSVAYLVGALQLVSLAGPGAWRPARLWTLAGIAAGQAAIVLGWAPSMIPGRAGDGVAGVGAFAFLLVSGIAESITADRERAWERLGALVHNSSDMVVVLDEEARATFAAGACERITGLTAEELQDAELGAIVHPDDVEPVRTFLLEALDRPEPTEPVEMRVRHRDGEWHHVEAVGANLRANPAISGVVLNIRDVTDRKRAEAELARAAAHDALTGLPNRHLFLDRLTAALVRGRARGSEPAVLFLDLDRFKLINDSLGHDVGDQLLVEVGRRLRSALPTGDTVARFGGDEFVIVCESGADAASVARRVLEVFSRPFRLGDEDHYVTASIGLATPEHLAADPAELIRDADTAMYRAKEQGRGRLHVFDEEARAAAVGRAHTEQQLRKAAERGELRLVYQPIVDLATDQVVGVEALLRWHHPQLGLLGPDRFIAVAEDSGLILPIGDWVLFHACRQAEVWASTGSSLDLAVNVSARQLADESLVESVARAVTRLNARGPRLGLTLELTETAFIEDSPAVIERMRDLKRLGVRLAMDDFGTGYSSLANLRTLPVDILKIDRRFVAGMADSEDDGTIVRSIIALAKSLGRTVVAEGVENARQLEMLRDLGCDLAQGYHLGRPQAAPDRLEGLRRRLEEQQSQLVT